MNKLTAGFLSFALLTVSASSISYANEAVPGSSQYKEAPSAADTPSTNYLEVTGVIENIQSHGLDGINQMVTVVNDELGITNFIITAETKIEEQAKLVVGDTITGYYDANAPAILIYPPQYKAVSITKVSSAGNSATDKYEFPPIEGIVVNDKLIDAPEAYIDENDVVMVPLRAIASALGYEVTWEKETQTVRLGNGIALQIGQDHYIYMKTPVIQLGAAPVLVEGTTYVPLPFFKKVVRMNNAYFFESMITIDNHEEMK